MAQDLREWRLASGRPDPDRPVVVGRDGERWTEVGYQHWRAKTWSAALDRAGVPYQRPYEYAPQLR